MKNWILLVVFSLFGIIATQAQSTNLKEIEDLQAEMYKYFSTPDQEKFMEVTEQLKEKSLAINDEQTYYKAWGNQIVYLALHDQRTKAMDIVKEMKQYAAEHDSKYGEYTALHVQGTIYLRMQNYSSAEISFVDAAELLHTHFPGESAAADYLELVTIANRRNDAELGKKYCEKVLREPNLQPQHKIRAFSLLCQYAYVEGNTNRFNELYNEWKEMLRTTTGGALESTVEVEYLTINGRYQEALELCNQVPVNTRANHQAKIYHLMGDDANAYKYLRQWVTVKDSINREEQTNLFSEYIIQTQNERLENERLRREGLETENDALRTQIYIILIVSMLIIFTILLYNRHKKVKNLRKDNKNLDVALQKAEKAQGEAQKELDIKREFLYNLSQELRAPLNPITGMSDLLTDDEYNLQTEERVAMSQHIKDNSRLLTKMIDNMMELSFYESKVSLPMDAPISPNLICSQMADTLRKNSPKDVEVLFETTIPDIVSITTNVECVEKIIKHLANNAFEHTTMGSVTICCNQQRDYISISVEDTGTGVAPELIDPISEMLKTGSHVKTTGMGLSICQAMLKLLNGHIYLDKKYKGGARFVFELPINPA